MSRMHRFCLCIVFALFLVGLLAACGNTTDTSSTSPGQSTPVSTAVQPKPTLSPAPQPPHATSPLLGSDIHLFLARYGKPDVIQGAQYLYYKGVDLSVVHQGSASRVNTIIITGNGTWNADQAKAACTPFIPQDAHSQRTYSSTSKSNGIAYTETTYLSPSLAQQLPADVFLNASAQPEAPGMFTMGLGHHKGSTNQFDACYVSTSLVIL